MPTPRSCPLTTFVTMMTSPAAVSTLLLFLLGSFTTRDARGQDISLVYTINEERPAGTFVGNVSEDSNIRDLVGSEQEFGDLTYSFLAEGSNVAANFRLQSDSGALYTKTRLDREDLCRYQKDCRLSLRMAAQSSLGLFFKIIDVAVVLNDINDNAPSFEPPVTELTVMENADLGDLFQLPPAIDADTGTNNSVKDYSLLTSNVPFRLHSQGLSAQEGGLWLRLNDVLDRELIPSYRLLMVARDGGSPIRSGTLIINVKVGDVNDHAPTWDQAQYTVNVSEVTAVNSTLLTLSAYDADSGLNGLLAYRFTPLQPDTALGLFRLNATSGQLQVAKPLDSYAGQMYRLEVEARDSGTPFKATRTDVVIRVLDTHNSMPDIILSVFGQGNVSVLSEFSELGRVVAHIAVEDPDKGLNGIVECTVHASHFQLQAMDVRQYKVILSQPLDRETQDTHLVRVTCKDAGSPPLSTSTSFSVQVRDENDEIPEFTQTLYQARVRESSASSGATDEYVATVKATDGDVGENARMSYRVMDDPRNEFRVLDNGTVLAVRGLDRETGSSQRYLRVVAHDHGAIENSATATLFLTVLDINDNPPVFTDPSPLFYVSETAPVTSYVGNVTATDADTEENAIVLFRMHPAYEGRVPFKVITDGVIKTNGTLDRESKDRHEFVVLAYDLGKPQLTTTVTVTVRVMDENDNSPIFVFPNTVNNSVSVPHTLSPNTAVTSLVAYDVDLGRNKELVFSRDGRNGTKYFDVTPRSGEVILVQPLSEHELGDHMLAVVVHDLGFPTQLANQTLLYIHVYRGNQSALSPPDTDNFRNTLLVVVIVAVTVVLSVTVVIAMLLMKRNDRQRRLYRAKEEESKVDTNLRQLTTKPLSQECNVSSAGSDFSSASMDPRRRKEVSFSLDEDNNLSTGSTAAMFDSVAVGSLETIPEMTPTQVDGCEVLGMVHYRPEVKSVSCAQSKDSKASQLGSLRSLHRYDTRDCRQKCLLEPRGQDDNMSDVSGDVSTSDSGRGGSDVEMHTHHGAAKESGDTSFASHRTVLPSNGDGRRPSQQRSVTFDLYPTTFASRGSGRLTTFPTSHLSNDVSDNPRHNMASFSSFSPLSRNGVPARASTSSSTSSLPSSRRHQLSSARHHGGSIHDVDEEDLPLPHPATSSHEGEGEEGSYVDLKRQQRRHTHGDYMDMTGNPTYAPSSQLSVGTVSTWDRETSTSGSYTVDPLEYNREMDKLFLDKPKDVVV